MDQPLFLYKKPWILVLSIKMMVGSWLLTYAEPKRAKTVASFMVKVVLTRREDEPSIANGHVAYVLLPEWPTKRPYIVARTESSTKLKVFRPRSFSSSEEEQEQQRAGGKTSRLHTSYRYVGNVTSHSVVSTSQITAAAKCQNGLC